MVDSARPEASESVRRAGTRLPADPRENPALSARFRKIHPRQIAVELLFSRQMTIGTSMRCNGRAARLSARWPDFSCYNGPDYHPDSSAAPRTDSRHIASPSNTTSLPRTGNAGPRSMRSGRSTRLDAGRQTSPSTAATSTRAHLQVQTTCAEAELNNDNKLS